MSSISINKVSAILITKEKKYPQIILKNIDSAGFGEVIIKTECRGIFSRYNEEPRFQDVYIQDDDCIAEISKIISEYDGKTITCGMTKHHLNFYSKSRICLIGHGAFFPWSLVSSLDDYRKKFGSDEDYNIEVDRIFTFLNFPQRRVETTPLELSSSFDSDRLSMRKGHYKNLEELEEKLIRFYCFSSVKESLTKRILLYCRFHFRKW